MIEKIWLIIMYLIFCGKNAQVLCTTDLEDRVYSILDKIFIPNYLNITEENWLQIKNSFLNDSTITSSINERKMTFKNDGMKLGNFSFPGTKWCGPGNTAKSESDFGADVETDKCCWTHDHCPVSIDSGKIGCKNNLKNDGKYTLSLCSCDKTLSDCLYSRATVGGDKTAATIGYLFGHFMGQCVNQDGAGNCAIVNGTRDYDRFLKAFLDQVKGDQDAFMKALSKERVKGYKCFSHVIYSGTVLLSQFKVECSIGSPFDDTVEPLIGADALIIKMVCCEFSSSWCTGVFPLGMGVACPDKNKKLKKAGEENLAHCTRADLKELKSQIKVLGSVLYEMRNEILKLRLDLHEHLEMISNSVFDENQN